MRDIISGDLFERALCSFFTEISLSDTAKVGDVDKGSNFEKVGFEKAIELTGMSNY